MSEASTGKSAVSLSDKYEKRGGRILISGVQAIVRLMLLQAERDKAAGLNTQGFVSGYRGSPLGTLDMTFARAAPLPAEHGIVVIPAVNEELAATAVAGTQQLARSPGARVDGVFSLWYGKGPGLDRAADAIRHGNMLGSAPSGGVVVAVGDDHVSKSSSIVCNSDDTVVSLQMPLFYPADPNEIVTFGLHAFALSRATGSWAALKIITEVADSTRAVDADELDATMVAPAIAAPPQGLHVRWPETPLEQEAKQQDYRLPAVTAYVRANRLDRIVHRPDAARIGLIAAGKSWMDLAEALRLLGLDEARLSALGTALYKPAVIWPLEPEGLGEFAAGLETLVVVEEKGALLEDQVKAILYGRTDAPAVYGKRDGGGAPLFPRIADLTPELVASRLGPLLHALRPDADLAQRRAAVKAELSAMALATPPAIVRKPFFCSGCPHNRSTPLPEGSRATAGIGCHGLAAYNTPGTDTFVQMGGEGIHWMGMAPFTDEKHIFANQGDGTYFHSGLLAIRQAVAANLTITYKLLYNDAVAMTGGQSVDGELSVEAILDQLRGEGVQTVIVATEDPQRHPRGGAVRQKATRVEHRDRLDALQRQLRDQPGVSVIVYDQTCATELRRLRKRGLAPRPSTHVFVNELVCEGCGDCSAKSNCLSVEPVETPLGTKRRINQSSCNKDFSCLEGFCPSFVTVEGGQPKRSRSRTSLADLAPLPEPARASAGHQRIVVAGVGGTGVVTISALLAMAGHIAGRSVAVLDQVGMAQKGGAVASHVHIADGAINAVRVPAGQADLVIACDMIVANARDAMASIRPGHSYVLANADVSITGDFTRQPDAMADRTDLARRLSARAGEGRFVAHPFTRLAERLLGDAIGSNLMMVGFAFQMGWLSLDLPAFRGAVELNAVGVRMNLEAFEWGRRLALDADIVYRAAQLASTSAPTIEAIIAERTTFLQAYQNTAYADRYKTRVEGVLKRERALSSEATLTEAVARSLFNLMAYKDEYEVARLYTDGTFERALRDQFEGDLAITFHLAQPILAGRDSQGRPRKRRFGSWTMILFRLLARMKGLRGTRLDPFGFSAERRMERALVQEYEELVDDLLARTDRESLERAAEIAALAKDIRGFGPIKEAAVARYRKELSTQLVDFARDHAAEHATRALLHA